MLVDKTIGPSNENAFHSDESCGTNLRQTVGSAVSVGTQLLWREQKSKAAFKYLVPKSFWPRPTGY